MMKKITKETEEVYHNLCQSYEAEFSPLTGEEPDENGKFVIATPINEKHHGYLYYHEKTPIGFIVVDIRQDHFDVAETYVIPKYRKNGIGEQMIRYVCQQYSGKWTTRQVYAAKNAQAFWRTVIPRLTNGNFIEDEILDPKWGRMMRQTFIMMNNKSVPIRIQLEPERIRQVSAVE